MDNKIKNNGSLTAGLIFVGIGIIILLKQLNIFQNFEWLFNWKTLLIAIGVIGGAKREFKQPYGWAIPIALGTVFLIGDYTNIHLIRYIVPLVLVGIGIVMILNTSTNNKWLKDFDNNNFKKQENNYYGQNEPMANLNDDANNINDGIYNADSYINNTININSFFSGSKQVVTHKNFKGGSVNAVMGGAEINLMQADMQNPAVLDVMIIMGGLKLVIPPTWQIKNAVGCLFGGIEDKRPQVLDNNNTTPRILILKGTTIMGGVDVRSY